MIGKRQVGAILAAAVLMTALSGCWVLRESFWTVDKVKPGNATKLRLGLAASDNNDPPGRFFMALNFKSSGGIKLRPAFFDSTGVLGNPKKMVKDLDLLAFLGDEDVCDSILSGGTLYRTQGNVSSDTRKFIEASLRAKTPNGSDGGGFGAQITTGEWRDDGDLIPEPDPEDEYECSGEATSGFVIKGSPSPRILAP